MPHDYTAEINAAFARYEATRAKIVALPLMRFEAGPYHPPQVQVGDWVECAYYGTVRVVGWSQGPLPWPQCRAGRNRSLILFEDLARAVATEGRLAVAIAWGVSQPTVGKWRRCLQVEHHNAGSTARHRAIVSRVMTPTQNAAGLERSRSIPARLRAQATRAAGALPCPYWTPEIVALMGVATDVEIAARLGCHSLTVGIERRRRGIVSTLGSSRLAPLRLDGQKLRQRRCQLGLTQPDAAARYGCTKHHIGKCERQGIGTVTRETLEKFARALECVPDDLLASDTNDATN